MLIVNGYTFEKEITIDKNTKWRCNEPNNNQTNCTVFVYLNEHFEVILIRNNHNHEPILCRTFQDRIM